MLISSSGDVALSSKHCTCCYRLHGRACPPVQPRAPTALPMSGGVHVWAARSPARAVPFTHVSFARKFEGHQREKTTTVQTITSFSSLSQAENLQLRREKTRRAAANESGRLLLHAAHEGATKTLAKPHCRGLVFLIMWIKRRSATFVRWLVNRNVRSNAFDVPRKNVDRSIA